MTYNLIPWKEYDVVDNGALAPKGSHPRFFTEYGNMKHDENPKHPNVIGYILHDLQGAMDVVPKRVIDVNYLKL